MKSPLFLDIADLFFLIFHSGLILFNLFAWIWRPLRKWHLLTISLTLVSWVFLGIFYGWGYCPLTDWHWDILRQKGISDLPNSYISYLIERILQVNISGSTVDILTLMLAITAFLISLKVNFWPRNPN